jgi:DNA-directed RNA polymerase specialized sigma24 family protein
VLLRHVEQLSTREIASVMESMEEAVETQYVWALQRLRGLLNDGPPEQKP